MANVEQTIALAGTYTLDPIRDVLEFWRQRLGSSAHVVLAPYGQLYQELLDPGSLTRRNQAGANVLCIRWCDLVAAQGRDEPANAWAAREAAIDSLSQSIAAVSHGVPCLVVCGPEPGHDALSDRANKVLRDRLAGIAQVHVTSGEEISGAYPVSKMHDANADKAGHVPFSPEGFAALGTAIARWYSSLTRKPLKAIAVDCDNTLWGGVVGEDGPHGIEIHDGHRALQRTLVQQAERGRLIILLSKNEEADVMAVLDARSDMVLKREHIVAHRIDWSPKPTNLAQLATELELGLDTFLFLDDSGVECAQMQAECPSVLTFQIPADAGALVAFVRHLWLFDQPRVTKEDRVRVQMYRDNAARIDLRRETPTLAGFIASLDLRIDISAPTAADIPRLSQLTQRTTQFNASLLASTEAELTADCASVETHTRCVRVKDRFGDYGIVGLMRGRERSGTLVVDQFLLSCRAMGRGVEHAMLAALGEIAVERGLSRVDVLIEHGPRNTPARAFFASALPAPQAAGVPGHATAPAADVAAIRFDPDANAAAPVATEPSPETGIRPDQSVIRNVAATFGEIARQFCTAAAITEAMQGVKRERPNQTAGFVSPAPGIERTIADTWESVLGVAPVGANDRFVDLGGRSIHLVRIHSRLIDKLKLDFDFTTLFQHATVAQLASHLAHSIQPSPRTDTAIDDRAARMRSARARPALASGGRT